MILLLKLDGQANPLRFQVTDTVIDTSLRTNNELPTRARRAGAWRHKRGVSAIARSEAIARMMLEDAA